MSREPETNRYPHLSLFVCFCSLVCLFAQRNAKAFTCFGFLFCLSFFFLEKRGNNFFFEHSYSLNFVVVYHAIGNTLSYFWWAVEQQPAEEFTIRHFQQQYPSGAAAWLQPHEHLDYEMSFETCISSGKFVREIDYQRNICKEIC